jgi:hypothetical protein
MQSLQFSSKYNLEKLIQITRILSRANILIFISDAEDTAVVKQMDKFNMYLDLFVEVKVRIRFLHVGSVSFFKVLGEDDISVFANSMHACFLTDCSNLKCDTQK